MTVLLLMLVWLLSAPVVALLVTVVCRGGAVDEDSWPDGWPDAWPDEDSLVGGPGGRPAHP